MFFLASRASLNCPLVSQSSLAAAGDCERVAGALCGVFYLQDATQSFVREENDYVSTVRRIRVPRRRGVTMAK